MLIKLISLALAIIPFCLWPGFDTRQPKLFMALVFSLALGLYAFYKGYFKSYKNIGFLLFIAFLPINFFLAPKVDMKVAGVQVASWILQSSLFAIVFFLAHVSLNSYQFTDEDKTKLLKIMVWVGLIMALYGIAQGLGLEQFFKGKAIAGTFGNPNVLATFLAMIIPMALYLKKYIQAVVMLIVVFLTNSQVAYGAMIVSLIFLVGASNKRLMIIMLSLFIGLFLILSVGYFKSSRVKAFVNDSGRFPIWSQVIQDIKTPMVVDGTDTKQYSFTGYGLGSFRYLFHVQHKNDFLEAHNDYLELLYNTGIIGLGLFLLGIFYIFKEAFPLDRLNTHLVSSLICATICAGGVFIWQNGATIFYTLVIVGLLNKQEEAACKVN